MFFIKKILQPILNLINNNNLLRYFNERNEIKVTLPFFSALGCDTVSYGQTLFISEPYGDKMKSLGFKIIDKTNPIHKETKYEEEQLGWPVLYHQRYNICVILVPNTDWDCLVLAIKLCMINTNNNELLKKYFEEIKKFSKS